MNTSQPEDNSQDEGRKLTPQQLFLIGLLGLVFVVVIVVSILILNRPQTASQQLPSEQQDFVLATEIIPSLTPTNTITSSPGATFTPKPTRTQTQAPTFTATPLPTLLPSITPAYPSEHNDQYELVLWTPELANQLIDILEVYPETLSSFARGDDNQGYYDAFQYALFAQREGLLRFPSSPQADTWQWQAAYNLARTGDQTAGEVYAKLITQELNRENTSLDELYVWGLKQDPQLLIESFLLEPGENELSSNLVKVTAEENGSAYFWLIENSTGYSSSSLTSDFDFVNPNLIDNICSEFVGFQW